MVAFRHYYMYIERKLHDFEYNSFLICMPDQKVHRVPISPRLPIYNVLYVESTY